VNTDATEPNDEKTTDNPAEQLAEAEERMARMSRDLDDLHLEQKLTHKLAAAGAVDLETAVLVAKARIEGQSPTDPDTCVAQLRKEKPYLFGGPTEAPAARKTAGAKDRTTTGPTALEQAARKATQTGSRADLHHYLKLRRNLL